MAHPGFLVGPAWPPHVSAYDYTRTLSNWDWAWEVVRRSPTYQHDCRINLGKLSRPEHLTPAITVHRLTAPVPRAEAWGLSAFHRSFSPRSSGACLLVSRDCLARPRGSDRACRSPCPGQFRAERPRR